MRVRPFNHGDRRLRAVATLAHEPYTPGVENAKLRARLGELLIPGTQATPACYEHLRRMLLARQYAFEYNVALLSLIQGTSP